MKKLYITYTILYASALIAQGDFSITSIKQLMEHNQTLQYTKLGDAVDLALQPLPIALSGASSVMPTNLTLNHSFMLSIPNGQAYSNDGFIITDGHIVDELIWPLRSMKSRAKNLLLKDLPAVKKVPGKVAVLTLSCKPISRKICYAHWMIIALSRLALLKMHNIEYDWLYAPMQTAYQRETLALLGVDLSKVIDPYVDPFIEADELIVPSFISPAANRLYKNSSYTAPWVVQYLRSMLIPLAEQHTQDSNFSKRIFISRADAVARTMPNENEIMSILGAFGFKRYVLSELSLLQQVALFAQAEIIVGSHGAGLINIMFAQPSARVFEIFQKRITATYWYIGQMVGVQHICIPTIETASGTEFTSTTIPLTAISKITSQLSGEQN